MICLATLLLTRQKFHLGQKSYALVDGEGGDFTRQFVTVLSGFVS